MLLPVLLKRAVDAAPAETLNQQHLQPSSNSSAVGAVGHQQFPETIFVNTPDYQNNTERNH